MPSERSPRVLIVGAGIGGLFLAQFLRKKGIPFAIFERDASPSARGAGWAIGLSMLEDYAHHMPEDVPPLRSASHLLPLALPSQFIMYPPGGARIGVEDTPATPCVRANRQRLREILLTSVPVQWDKHAVGVTENKEDHTVTVSFADGTTATGDVLVGADGTWSKVREAVLGRPNAVTLQAVPMSMVYGEVALTGDALVKQLRLGHSAYLVPRPATGKGSGNGNGTNGVTGSTGATPGRASGSAIFFCGLDRVEADGQTGYFYWFLYERDDDAAAPDHWLRTAPREAKYAHVLARTAEAGVEPHYTEIVRAGGAEAVSGVFSLYYDAVLQALPAGRRTLLVGDAAHPTTPFRGEGGIQAIKDVLRLSEVLAAHFGDSADTLQAALDTFQKDVSEAGAQVVQMSRDAVLGAKPPPGKPHSWGFEVRPIPERDVSLNVNSLTAH
ncbi:Aromatic-ring hydroxylase-like protein [Niveomyces insectorum RCEF 264]|uniref:Aromatic-ring hydroxylase-like protein n=1 Tax=Niveomyces insectorum RCEF 264 TaxID=1081102 RepID=A0A167SSY2_9HYPO|nr:Aromatic-ring hydroxylase-like protein [Niveomyces insectorum RCEF 264]